MQIIQKLNNFKRLIKNRVPLFPAPANRPYSPEPLEHSQQFVE